MSKLVRAKGLLCPQNHEFFDALGLALFNHLLGPSHPCYVGQGEQVNVTNEVVGVCQPIFLPELVSVV